jgi:hypothetical protein
MRSEKRSIGIALFVLVLSLGNYMRLTGTENIRAIHIITLLTMGVAIGVMLVHIFKLVGRNKTD